MKTQAQRSSYLLIDGAQLAVAELSAPQPDDARDWLAPVYDASAAVVTPLVIDIEAVCRAGAVDYMMGIAAALQPQLHASVIDTTMSHEALTQHLRRFIMIRTNAGKAYTLRFADCSVLPILAAAFTPPQWAALAGPLARWCVHDFDGKLRQLPPADTTLSPAPTPLVLSDDQLALLHEATAPSMMLAHLFDIGHGEAMPGTSFEQHRWATKARFIWRSAGNTDDIALRWLTSAALATRGQVLNLSRLPTLLENPNLAEIREGLLAAIGEHHAQT